jgi:hypothetical protein
MLAASPEPILSLSRQVSRASSRHAGVDFVFSIDRDIESEIAAG